MTKFLVYNARKRQEGGDAASAYFERTECVAGVQDARFQQLMPDAIHWLGLRRIDRFVSMSDMKYDALVGQGIEIVERVPLPDELVPADAHVEMDAKKAAGYFTPDAAAVGRRRRHDGPGARQILNAVFWRRFCRRSFLSAHFMSDDTAAALSLLNAAAVRTRAKRMLELGLDDKLPHFRIDLARLDHAADLVAATTRKNYPTLDVPFHSRWRHFVTTASIAGRDDCTTSLPTRKARARAAFDLAIVSVLLDAGAGPQWRYHEPLRGDNVGRSEGLALASFIMFAAGAFSRQSITRRNRQQAARRCEPRWLSSRRKHLRARLSGTANKSARRSRGPRRTAALRSAAWCVAPGHIRARRRAAARRLFRSPRREGRERRNPGAAHPVRSYCCNSGRSGRRG